MGFPRPGLVFFPDWNLLRLSRIGKSLRIAGLAFPDWLRIGFNYPARLGVQIGHNHAGNWPTRHASTGQPRCCNIDMMRAYTARWEPAQTCLDRDQDCGTRIDDSGTPGYPEPWLSLTRWNPQKVKKCFVTKSVRFGRTELLFFPGILIARSTVCAWLRGLFF